MFKKLLQWNWDNFDLASDAVSGGAALILILRYYWVEPTATTNELLVGILGVLLVLAISGFVEKRNRLSRIESLSRNNVELLENKVINRIKASEFFNKEQKLDEDFFAKADTIFLTGITLGKTVRQFTSILSTRLHAGADIKIIIVSPEKEPIRQIEFRSFGKVDEGYYKNRLKSTMDLIKITGDIKEPKGSLTIGLLPYVPSFGIAMVDPLVKHGAAQIEIYHHHSADPMPTFSLTSANDPFWYEFFYRQFNLMWDNVSQKIVVSEKIKNKLS